MRKAQFAAVFLLAFFALVGGCLILAQDGFTTSGKHGQGAMLVPAPQAYLMAAIMFALSVLALIGLLQQMQASRLLYLIAAMGYGSAIYVITKAWASYL